MGVLDQVIGMKKQGYSDANIINELTQQRVSPREISEALKQAEIKNAVSDYDYGGSGMEQSVMQNGNGQYAPAPNYDQQPLMPSQEYVPEEQSQQQYQPQYTQQEYAPQEAPAYNAGGYDQQYAPAPAAMDTDTIMEISDQVFSDKIKKFQKILDATSEAAIMLQSKFDNISERLKKIESTIDKLQIAILEKVGSYGQNLESIKKEMSMMGDSFSKMISQPREQPKSQIENIPEFESNEEEIEPQKRISKKK